MAQHWWGRQVPPWWEGGFVQLDARPLVGTKGGAAGWVGRMVPETPSQGGRHLTGHGQSASNNWLTHAAVHCKLRTNVDIVRLVTKQESTSTREASLLLIAHYIIGFSAATRFSRDPRRPTEVRLN